MRAHPPFSNRSPTFKQLSIHLCHSKICSSRASFIEQEKCIGRARRKTARGKYLGDNASYKGSEGFMARSEWFTWRNRSLNIFTPNWPRARRWFFTTLTAYSSSGKSGGTCFFLEGKVHFLARKDDFMLDEIVVPGTAHHREFDKSRRWLWWALSDKAQYPAEIEKRREEWIHACSPGLDESVWRPSLSHGAKLVYHRDTLRFMFT